MRGTTERFLTYGWMDFFFFFGGGGQGMMIREKEMARW